MKTTLVFACLIAVAVSRHAVRETDEDIEYQCLSVGHQRYPSACFFDACSMVADPPCSNKPEAVCRSHVCPNPTCDLMFFVGAEPFENCTVVFQEE